MACGVREGLWEKRGGRPLWGRPEELEAGSLRSRKGSHRSSPEAATGTPRVLSKGRERF